MTSEEYLNRVRALMPAIRERAPYMEQLRRLPDETLKEFQEAGLFRAIQPRRYGGYELDPGVFFQAGMEIGTVCGSSAWILTVVGVHNWQLGLFPPQAQEDVWHEDSSTADLLGPGANRDSRMCRWGLPAARALVVLEWLRFLPMGRPRGCGPAHTGGRAARCAQFSCAAP